MSRSGACCNAAELESALPPEQNHVPHRAARSYPLAGYAFDAFSFRRDLAEVIGDFLMASNDDAIIRTSGKNAGKSRLLDKTGYIVDEPSRGLDVNGPASRRNERFQSFVEYIDTNAVDRLMFFAKALCRHCNNGFIF